MQDKKISVNGKILMIKPEERIKLKLKWTKKNVKTIIAQSMEG